MAFVLCLAASLAVHAQGYPNRPIKVVVPYAAGGLPDTMARLAGQKMGDSMGQQLVIENRGGAGGIVGTAAVAKAAPDGYALAEIGFYAPAGTPGGVVSRLAAEVQKALKQPDVAQRFKQLGIDPVGSTPEAYNAANRASYRKYERVVKASGAKID